MKNEKTNKNDKYLERNEDFHEGWKEGYITAIDEMSYKMKAMIEEIYDESLGEENA